MDIKSLERPGKPRLSYILSEETKADRGLPAILFLCGYRSDMEGTKATFLEKSCRARGQMFLRFDYSGHGVSDGKFEDGTIGAWTEDALAVIEVLPPGEPLVLIGSSMGGWIALNLLRARPERVHGLIGIAAAPDFSESIYASLSDAQKQALDDKGSVRLDMEYNGEPQVFTRQFYEEAKNHLFLKSRHRVDLPVRLLQGQLDKEVPWQTAGRIADRMNGPDIRVLLVEGGDHRLSRPEDLALLEETLIEVSERIAAKRISP